MPRPKQYKTTADRQRAYRQRKKLEAQTANIEIDRPAFRYHGGKWRDAENILACFPKHEHYVEPFGGAGSVLLRKRPSAIETYNDLDATLVNFFYVLRSQPAALLAALDLTLYSRLEYELAHEPCDDPLEQARRTYVKLMMGRGRANSQWHTGWRYLTRDGSGGSLTKSFANNKHLLAVAQRIKTVQIENDNAVAVIERYDTPETLFYVDPPYVLSTRTKWGGKAYRHEMTDDDHRELARALHSVKGMVVLSGYQSDLYRDLYSGWEAKTYEAVVDNSRRVMTESLWLSPNAMSRIRQAQPLLFAV